MMGLRDTFLRILSEYPTDRSVSKTGHHVAAFLRDQAPEQIANVAGEGFTYKGSSGPNVWAITPWVAVMDPLVTNSTQHGFYVVYLFNIKEQIVFLSLNQGVTAVKDEFGGGRIQKDVLEARASIMLQRLDRQDRMPVNHITLSSASDLSESYQWGHVTGFGYKASNLPREEVLVRDLEAALRAYRSLIERNGYTLEEEGGAGPQKVEEKRRLRMHERIERMAADPRKIKKHKGFICEVCDFDFEANYGALGHEFIEAHHLTPIGTLEAGMSREVDIEKDFAVLCANCHRMIHRQDDPSDLDGLRKRLRERIQS